MTTASASEWGRGTSFLLSGDCGAELAFQSDNLVFEFADGVVDPRERFQVCVENALDLRHRIGLVWSIPGLGGGCSERCSVVGRFQRTMGRRGCNVVDLVDHRGQGSGESVELGVERRRECVAAKNTG